MTNGMLGLLLILTILIFFWFLLFLFTEDAFSQVEIVYTIHITVSFIRFEVLVEWRGVTWRSRDPDKTCPSYYYYEMKYPGICMKIAMIYPANITKIKMKYLANIMK
jgi:hypothetical protein